MRKTQLLDNNPNSIYGASKNLANVSIRNIMSNPMQNDAMSQNLKTILPLTITKDTNVEEFLGKILDCDSYLQQMYLFVYATEHKYDNHGRYTYKDRGTSNVLERDEDAPQPPILLPPLGHGAGFGDGDDSDYSLSQDDIDNLEVSDLVNYYKTHPRIPSDYENTKRLSDYENHKRKLGISRRRIAAEEERDKTLQIKKTKSNKNSKNNISTDSEKTYKMTEEDYKSMGVNPRRKHNQEYFRSSAISKNNEDDDVSLTKEQLNKLNVPQLMDYYDKKSEKINNKKEEDYKLIRVVPTSIPLPERKALLTPQSPLFSPKPSPIDIMNASMNNVANRRVYYSSPNPHDHAFEDLFYSSPQSSVSSHGGNPMRSNNSSKLVSPIVAKRGSSSNSSILNDSSNPGSIASSYHQSSNSSNTNNHLQIHPGSSSNSIISSDWSNPSSSSSSSNSSESSHYPASSNSARSNNSSWNSQSGYFDDDDGDYWDRMSSLSGFTGARDEFKRMPIEAPLIQEMSKFNTKINELYIFFKGKIKPNLKTISKQDIQDILKDMNQLDYNFTDVLHLINDLNVFGFEDKNIRHAKIDAFKQTFESNFKKSYMDIISSVKAYSSLGMYSTSSVPDNILFNSKFPTFDGKGLSFIPDSVRKNMHHSHKYLQ